MEMDKPKLSTEDLGGLKDKKEISEGKELSIDQLVADSNALIDTYEDQLDDLPDNFKGQLHDSIRDYFLTSADRYDQDSEVGLDVQEFANYSKDMLAKLEQIMDQYAPSEEEKEARQKQQEATVEAQEAVSAMEGVRLDNVRFNSANLGTPEGVQEELMKFNQRGGDLREQAGDMMSAVGDFQEAYQKFEESKLS